MFPFESTLASIHVYVSLFREIVTLVKVSTRRKLSQWGERVIAAAQMIPSEFNVEKGATESQVTSPLHRNKTFR